MKYNIRATVRTPRLEALRRRLEDPSPVTAEIALSMERMLRANIINEGRTWGAWAPMKPLTELKRRVEGKPLKLLYGFANLVYSSHGKTQATYGIKSKAGRKGESVALIHHEGRAGDWTITAKAGGWLYFPVLGKVVKKGRGREAERLYTTVSRKVGYFRRFLPEGQVGPPRRYQRVTERAKSVRKEKYNYIFMKKVVHKGIPKRPLLPPRKMATEKAREIVDNYLALYVR